MTEVNYNHINTLGRTLKRGRALRGVLVSAALFCSWPPNQVESMGAGRPSPFASPPLDFKATAYCDLGITKSGAPAGPGIVAADPSILSMGTLIWIDACAYSGVYQVMDTGRLVKGKIIDVFISDEAEALEFGRQKVKVIVLRYGYRKKQGIQESRNSRIQEGEQTGSENSSNALASSDF